MINNVQTRYILFCSLVLFFLIFPTFVFSQIETEKWYTEAEKYLAIDTKRYSNDNQAIDDIWKEEQKRSELQEMLSNLPKVPEDKLSTLLHSESAKDRKIALITIGLQRIYSKNIFEHIINEFHQEDDKLIKSYSIMCLRSLSKDQVLDLEDSIINNILSREKKPMVTILLLPVIMDMNNDNTKFSICAELLQQQDEEMIAKFAAMARSIGETKPNTFLKDFRTFLKEHNKRYVFEILEKY